MVGWLGAEVSMKNGVRLDQNPVVYASGTEFLMPGRKGAQYPVPEWAEEPLHKAATAAQVSGSSYSDEKVANREMRVWHFVIEKGY